MFLRTFVKNQKSKEKTRQENPAIVNSSREVFFDFRCLIILIQGCLNILLKTQEGLGVISSFNFPVLQVSRQDFIFFSVLISF